MIAWYHMITATIQRKGDLRRPSLGSLIRFYYRCYVQLLSLSLYQNFIEGCVLCFGIQLPSSKDKEAARFAQMWNKIISSFREEDLISDR